MILGFFEGENFQIYKYKMAKKPLGVWFSFFKNSHFSKNKKVKNLEGRRLFFIVFFEEKNVEILRKKCKNELLHMGFFVGGGDGITVGVHLR